MTPAKPTWIIFDVGGVLYDGNKSIINTAALLGVTPRELRHEYFKNFKEVEISNLHYKDKLHEILVSLNSTKTIEEVIPSLFNTRVFLPNSLALVRELHHAGFSLGLLTNTWHGVTEDVLSKLPEFPLFSHVFDSSKLRIRKPEHAMFDYVEKTLTNSGQQIFFIDDRLENIEKAKEFRWQTFLYAIGDDEGQRSNDAVRNILSLA